MLISIAEKKLLPQGDIEIVINSTASNVLPVGNTSNIPCFTYGQILSFCDAYTHFLSSKTVFSIGFWNLMDD